MLLPRPSSVSSGLHRHAQDQQLPVAAHYGQWVPAKAAGSNESCGTLAAQRRTRCQCLRLLTQLAACSPDRLTRFGLSPCSLQVVPTGLDVASSLQNGSGPNGSRLRRGKTLQTLFPIEVQVGIWLCVLFRLWMAAV